VHPENKPPGEPHVRAARSGDARDIAGLCDVLIDCVEGGASVSFMLPMSVEKAQSYWRDSFASMARGERLIFVAEETAGAIVGTVQLVPAQPENQPHRADLAKMLVHRRARRRGIGAALLNAAEQAALGAGNTTLVLDTVTGGTAERLYARHGWQVCGQIPNYALWPDGAMCSTTVFYKLLGK
jgi:GNAT superfamily N-acetyltransferase